MKKLFYLSVFSLVMRGGIVLAQNVGVGTATPDASAKLDIVDANRGILIPRVALTATNAAGPVTSPATSLLVYNTATAGTSPNNVWPGYYYWNGTQWVRIDTGNGDWKLNGNTLTGAAANSPNEFIGSTNDYQFIIRTNNANRFRISNSASQILSEANGSAALPNYSWNGDNTSGMYRGGAGQINFSVGGTERMRITNTPQILSVGDGTAGSPAWSWTTDNNTGIFNPGLADILGFSTNGTERMRIAANGYIGIATTAPAAWVYFVAPAALPAGGFFTEWNNNNNSNGAMARFYNTATGNGSRVLFGVTNYSASTYRAPGVIGLSLNTTTTGSGGVGVEADANNESGYALYAYLYYVGAYSGWAGYFNADVYCGGIYFGSDRRLKKDINPLTNALSIVSKLNPVTYYYDLDKYPNASFEERKRYGFIAQEVEQVIPELVKEKNIILNDRKPITTESLSEPKQEGLFKVLETNSLIPILTQAIKEQQSQIENLKQEIQLLKEEIQKLKKNEAE